MAFYITIDLDLGASVEGEPASFGLEDDVQSAAQVIALMQSDSKGSKRRLFQDWDLLDHADVDIHVTVRTEDGVTTRASW